MSDFIAVQCITVNRSALPTYVRSTHTAYRTVLEFRERIMFECRVQSRIKRRSTLQGKPRQRQLVIVKNVKAGNRSGRPVRDLRVSRLCSLRQCVAKRYCVSVPFRYVRFTSHYEHSGHFTLEIIRIYVLQFVFFS